MNQDLLDNIQSPLKVQSKYTMFLMKRDGVLLNLVQRFCALGEKNRARDLFYGYVYFSGVTLGSETKQQHRYNNAVTSGIPQAETFTPSYSFEKRNVANLPKEIPNLSGVGGRYGKMPEYNQGFGQSNKAASVSMTAPTAGAKFETGAVVTLQADAKDNDGTVKSVAFYVGNTLVGTVTASPYQVEVEDLEPGTHSAVAVVTDNSGLTWMSEYVTFTVEGSVIQDPDSESSSSRHCEEQSSDCDEAISSSSTTAIVSRANLATEAETGFYRIFDMQGRPLFAGDKKLAKMPAARVIVVEYTTAGKLKRRYLQLF